MMKIIQTSFVFLASVILIFSCGKNKVGPVVPPPDQSESAGLYVLNEGVFGNNNTMLTFYDFEQNRATTDFYKEANGNGLGDTGNDMLIYGGKLYIVMNVSSYLEVADATTAKNIKKIDLKNAGSNPMQPRNIVAYKNFVLVSCWDGSVQVVDTTSLAIIHSVRVGGNPEGMAVSGDRLYVANSGGLMFPDYDSTLSMVDLNTFTEIAKITVGLNPTAVAADDAGHIFVGFNGNYGNIPGGVARVDGNLGVVTQTAGVHVGKLKYDDGKLFATAGTFGEQKVQVLNPEDLSVEALDFVTDNTQIQSPYGLNIDGLTGDVYVGDQLNFISPGIVYCFDKSGKKKFSFSTTPGVGPNTIAFLRK